VSPRIRLSTCLARCSAAGGGGGPGGRDVRAAVAVAGHGDAGGAGEHDPVVGDLPARAAEAASELAAAGQVVFAADPSGQSPPGVVVDGIERRFGHRAESSSPIPEEMSRDELVGIMVGARPDDSPSRPNSSRRMTAATATADLSPGGP